MPPCEQCGQPVKRAHLRFCSHACHNLTRRYRAKACARCVVRPVTSRDAKYCESCARLRMAETRLLNVQKAQAKRRELWVEQFREKLLSLSKRSEIAREFYKLGYAACYSAYMRKIRRGDIQVVRERRMNREVA